MSLDWDISKVANRETVCWETVKGEKRLKVTTEALIWGTMAVGIGEVSEKTIPEWLFRLEVLGRIGGELMYKPGEDGRPVRCNPTAADLRAHIGLRTNVFPMERRAGWLKRRMDHIAREASYAVRTALES